MSVTSRPANPAAAQAMRHDIRRALHAEWTKLRTVPSTPWLLLAIVAFTVIVSAGAVGSVSTSHCPSPTECFEDTTKLSLTGVWLGQAAVAVLAILSMTSEYGTRMIQTTLAVTPRRVTVLLTKATVVTAIVLAAATVGVLGSLIAGRIILPGNGFTAANGYPPLSLADGPTLRAVAGTVLYVGIIALLSLSVGTIVRDTAGAITAVLSLLYIAPLIATLVSDPQWSERLQTFTPSTAGLAIQATTDLDRIPIGPWAGLGVLAAYAIAAMLAGVLLFKTRDT
ncbi:MAG: ABC transporter permease [Jiangellaceae bacterium]